MPYDSITKWLLALTQYEGDYTSCDEVRNGIGYKDVETGKKFILPVPVFRDLSPWEEIYLRDIVQDLRTPDGRHRIGKKLTSGRLELLSTEVILNNDEETLVGYSLDGDPDGHVFDLGVHDVCNGTMSRLEVSKSCSAIVCEECYFRDTFPNVIKTYAELRSHFHTLMVLSGGGVTIAGGSGISIGGGGGGIVTTDNRIYVNDRGGTTGGSSGGCGGGGDITWTDGGSRTTWTRDGGAGG